MATIPYIGSGSGATAARMNTLWAEFDRKMTLAMDGKSWLLLQESPANAYLEEIMGARFFFTDLTTFGRSVDIGGASPAYDHSPFAPAIAGATEAIVLHPEKIVFMTGLGGVNLDDSLEAHRRSTLNADGAPEDYWVWDLGKTFPQRRHRYAVAELVFEDASETSYTIPITYDKYQYFRLHNLNFFAITVRFEGPGGATDSFAVPALGCRCVQRRPGGRMQAGYNYFWRFLPGDPRSLTTADYDGNRATDSMGANNVWNPALIYEVIELFSDRGGYGLGDGSDINPVRIIRDPHVMYSIAELYGDYFADPAVSTNLLGDVVHHKGEVHYCYRDTGDVMQRVVGRFEGYGDLAALSSMGLTVVSTSGGVSIQGTLGSEFNDLVTPGSNLLFGAAGDVVTAEEISSARNLDHSQPANETNLGYSEMFRAVTLTADTEDREYGTFTTNADRHPVLDGTLTTISLGTEAITTSVTDEITTLKPHTDTIATALLFNTFGLIALNGTNQNSSVATLEQRRLVLTIWGPVFVWEQRYAFPGSVAHGNVFADGGISPGRPYARRNASNELVEHRYLPWNGYGWPEFPRRTHVVMPNFWNGTHGGFIGPRRVRAVNALTSGKHPNYGQALFGPNGEDFTIIPGDREGTEARLLFTPGYVSPAAGHMPIWTAADQLYEYELAGEDEAAYVAMRAGMQGTGVTTPWMPRVKLLREHYNTMAAWVNSCVKCRPFCCWDLKFYLPATSEAGAIYVQSADVYDNGIVDSGGAPGIGTMGILATSVRPLSQFTAFEDGSFLHHLFTDLGVTVKTEADLPAGFLSALTASAEARYFQGTYDTIIDTVTSIGVNQWRYKYHEFLTGISLATTTSGNRIGAHNANGVFDANRASWPVTSGDDLDLGDYRWVTILDVKAAMEALGLKFIFEETSLPLALEEFTRAGSWTVLDDTSPYYYFDETSALPRSTGVIASGTFPLFPIFTEFVFDTEQARFAEKTSGAQWKRDCPGFAVGASVLSLDSRVIADFAAADVNSLALGQTGPWWLVHLDATDEACKFDRALRALPDYRAAMMHQISASSGYTIQSGVWKIAVPMWYHPDDDFSLQSIDNARAVPTFGSLIYPLDTRGSYAGATWQGFGSGSNMMEPNAGAAWEPMFWKDTFVSLL